MPPKPPLYRIWRFARDKGLTREQAARLIKRYGSNEAKLNEAAERLKSRGRPGRGTDSKEEK
jgi:hypothetical protein